jgi:hypothetical protein
MRSTIPRLALRFPFAAALALITLLVSGRLQGATTWVVSFTIDDTWPNAKATSDLVGAYADYRLPLIPGDHGCIEADIQASSFFATLNRKIDAAGTRCDTAGSFRQFRIHVTSAPNACLKLTNAYGSGVVNHAVGECTLVWTANPRIRAEDLFKGGRVVSTPLAFLNDKVGLNGLSYEIQALMSVPMTAPSTNQRVLTYEGQGMLVEFGNGKTKFVAEAFDLDLRMVFDRFAQ